MTRPHLVGTLWIVSSIATRLKHRIKDIIGSRSPAGVGVDTNDPRKATTYQRRRKRLRLRELLFLCGIARFPFFFFREKTSIASLADP